MTFGFIILVLIALCCTVLLYLYHKYHTLHIFPESVAAVVFGMLVGLFIKYYYQSNNLMRILSFEPHTFFLFLLPPIMYGAGFSLKANIFFRSFGTISAYAVIATVIASLVFTLIFYYGTSLTSYPFFFIESFQFGCFISAIDPVATISIFKSLRVSEKLYMIVFGESALNDAVSIALAQSVENVGLIMEHGENVDYFSVTTGAMGHFLLYFFGSMLVGALCGIIVSFIFAKFDFHLVPWIEIGLFLILSYLPYVLSEGLGVSGILAIFMSAIFMRNYAFHSLSPIGQVTVESMVEMTCNVSENFVFAYMGLSVPITLNTVRLELIGIGMLSLLVSRSISVVLTSFIVNAFRKDKIPKSYQAIMSFSGLRGAVAFYLALNVNSEYKNLIITTTIGLIVVTIIGLGSTTTCLLKAMAKYFPEDGIFHNEEEDMLLRREGRYSGMSESLYDKNFNDEVRERGVPQDKSIGVITRLEYIDQAYGQKFLRKDGWEDFLGGDGQDKYEFVEYNQSPDKGKYYDNLSNYQKSVARYMDESAVNLPYEDRLSVRLSMMSDRRNPRGDQGKSAFLNPNKQRMSVRRDPYDQRNNLSRMGGDKSYYRSTRGEQMSIMSEPRRGMPRGLRGLGDSDTLNRNLRLNVPPVNINVARLDDISSKGSQAESKSYKERPKDDRQSANLPEVEEDQSKLQSFKQPNEDREENKVERRESSLERSRPRVTFQEPHTTNIRVVPLDEESESKVGGETKDSKEPLSKNEKKEDEKEDPEDNGNENGI